MKYDDHASLQWGLSRATTVRAFVLSAFCGHADTEDSTRRSIPSLSNITEDEWSFTVGRLLSDGDLTIVSSSEIDDGKDLLTVTSDGVAEILDYYRSRKWMAWSLMLASWLIQHPVHGMNADDDPISSVRSAFGGVVSDRQTIDRLLSSYGVNVRTDSMTLQRAFDGWVTVDSHGVYTVSPLGAASLGFMVSDEDRRAFLVEW